MKRSLLYLISILILLSPVYSQFKNLTKQLKSKAAEKVKEVVDENVKPLTIDYSIKKIHYNPLKSLTKLKLDIQFNGYNPNKIGVALDRIEFDLYINEKHASKFYNDKKIKIPKNNSFTFDEIAELKVNTIGKAVFDAIIKKKAKYQIDGTYHLDTQLGNFKLKAKLVEREI